MLTAAADAALLEDEIVRFQVFRIKFLNANVDYSINNMDINSLQINPDDRTLHNIDNNVVWRRNNFIRDYEYSEQRINLVADDGSIVLHATPTFRQIAFNNEQINIQLEWFELFRTVLDTTLYVMDSATRFMRGASYDDTNKQITVGLGNEFHILRDGDPVFMSHDWWRARIDANENALDIINLTGISTFKTPGS